MLKWCLDVTGCNCFSNYSLVCSSIVIVCYHCCESDLVDNVKMCSVHRLLCFVLFCYGHCLVVSAIFCRCMLAFNVVNVTSLVFDITAQWSMSRCRLLDQHHEKLYQFLSSMLALLQREILACQFQRHRCAVCLIDGLNVDSVHVIYLGGFTLWFSASWALCPSCLCVPVFFISVLVEYIVLLCTYWVLKLGLY